MRIAATWLMLLSLGLFALGCQKEAPAPSRPSTRPPSAGGAGEVEETETTEEAGEKTEEGAGAAEEGAGATEGAGAAEESAAPASSDES